MPFDPLDYLKKTLIPGFTSAVGVASIFHKYYPWKGSVGELIEAYRGIVHPIFEKVFFWLPSYPLIWDYLVVGLIVTITSIISTMNAVKKTNMEFPDRDKIRYSSRWDNNFRRVLAALASRVFLWPGQIVISYLRKKESFDREERKEYYKKFFDTDHANDKRVRESVTRDAASYNESVYFIQWLLTLGFVLLILFLWSSISPE